MTIFKGAAKLVAVMLLISSMVFTGCSSKEDTATTEPKTEEAAPAPTAEEQK